MTRAEQVGIYGGSDQGGIVPAVGSRNIFVYSDPIRGQAHGYSDGWETDSEVFLYTGDGQIGDQELRRRNKSLLNHRADGRRLRLMVADGEVPGTRTKIHRYVGEFEVDPGRSYTEGTGPDTNGNPRKIIVFRLRPVNDEYIVRPQDRSTLSDMAGPTHQAMVPLEVDLTDFYRVSEAPSRVASKREAQLVRRYRTYLDALGHVAERRWEIRPTSQLVPLLTDLFDETAHELYEAKGTATRNDVRMAIGQLFDYRRHIAGQPRLAVLLPEKPSVDVLDLIGSVGFACVYETTTGTFERSDPR